MVNLGLFFILFVRGAWIAVPANTDLVWAAGECICKDDKVSAALQMAREKIVVLGCVFLLFKGICDSEWVLLKWSVESGSKF